MVEYQQDKCVVWFSEEVANTRREIDEGPMKKQLVYVEKLKKNNFYEKMIEDFDCYKSAKLTRDEWIVEEVLRSPFFDDLEEIGETYEIHDFKRTAMIKKLYQYGIGMHQLAKLRMLEFYYDFLKKWLNSQNFELCYMDTNY